MEEEAVKDGEQTLLELEKFASKKWNRGSLEVEADDYGGSVKPGGVADRSIIESGSEI